MKLVSFKEPVSIAVKRATGLFNVSFQAYRPYVISNANFRNLYEGIEKLLYKTSHYDYRVPNFNVHAARKGQDVLYFNGSGGFGDQIMSWPVVKILASLGLKVHVATEPGQEMCWHNFPWVASVTTMPMEQSQLEMWKHLILLDAVVNFDEHPDQLHPVDTQLRRFGIDPETISPELKSVPPAFHEQEIANAKELVSKMGAFGIYQLQTTSPTRSLSNDHSLAVLGALARRFPKIKWIATHDKFVDADLKQKAEKIGLPNVKVHEFDNMRVFWAATGLASVCISPDSLLAHVAGCQGIPHVGLWGPMPPSHRVKYYRNHTAIWHKNACQFAPCFVSTHTFPPYCPPTPEPRSTCSVLNRIDPDEVCKAVEKYL